VITARIAYHLERCGLPVRDLEILEDLLLGFRLPVFTRRAKRELASHPRFYFFDAGVFRAGRQAGPLIAQARPSKPALFPGNVAHC